MMKKKIALFGGTFDPVHLGHTAVAAAAAEHIGAEKVIFIPAKRSPLKNFFPVAGDDDRLAMIALAIADNEKFQVDDYELRKPKPSYTLETVRHFQADYSGKALIYWLVGADSIYELSRWYGIIELIDECNLCVMFRAGCGPPDFARFKDVWGATRVEKLQRNIIRTPLIDISSTEIRNRLAAGRDVTGMLAPQVADYIRKQGLYQTRAGG
jgi:nicotinate-nucleotide adenylyltransferase